MNNNKEKIIAAVLSILLVMQILWVPRTSHAGVLLVIDIVQKVKELVADTLLKAVAKTLLDQLKKSIFQYLRTGDAFRGGGPLMITNFDRFLIDAADQAGSDFLRELIGRETYDNLCSPFRDHVFRRISNVFPRFGYDSYAYRGKASCTVQDIVSNLEAYYNNFLEGGWEAWYASIPYESNPFGHYFLAREEKLTRELRAAQENKHDFQTGSGFIASQICAEWEEHHGPPQPDGTTAGRTCKRTYKETIGSAVHQELESVLDVELDEYVDADEISEIMFLLADNFANLILGSGGLVSASVSHARQTETSTQAPKNPPGVPNTWKCVVDHGGGSASAEGGGSDGSGGSASINIQIKGTDDCKAGPGPAVKDPVLCDPVVDPFCVPSDDRPQCDDGIDNDHDGPVDLADSDCTSASDTTEGSGGGTIPPPPPPPPPPATNPPNSPGIPPPPPTL